MENENKKIKKGESIFLILISVILILGIFLGFYFYIKEQKIILAQRKIELNTSLFEAVRNSNLLMVQELIKQGADVNAKGSHNQVVLVSTDNPLIIKELIKQGADVNADSGGTTPLISASTSGNLDALKELIKQGADVNKIESEFGWTALVSAAAFGHIDIIKELVVNGANMELVDYSGHTALMWACDEGNMDVVKELIKDGADINVKNNAGSTALTYASGGGDRSGYPDIVEFLKKAGAK